MNPELTKDMVKFGVDQARLDSSVNLTADQRIERIWRAMTTGKVDRELFDESIEGL